MASRGGFTKNEGDWLCPDSKCGNTNFARRDKCNRCGSDKPRGGSSGKTKQGGFELGKQLAEKSKGLFSADDWQCKTCGNVNWARRGTCNVCNTPKVGQVEERTGFGGGFMERDENPEKIERNSDDEEYDEFGRRKKKYRGLETTQPAPPKEEEEPEEEEEEDDEEEEDSDDEDLGKYAFDSDDAEEVKKEAASSKQGDKSRSDSSRSSYSGYSRGNSSESESRSRSTSKKRDSSSRARSSSGSGSDSDSKRYTRSRSRSPIHRK